ncbi:hypothetical protein [Sulfuriflexus mobilis]|uniref:hypothetical protein n=1 Tax=Sulfuriflexus mobilis TaxID=1811807 RepID=UPI0011D02287|nr:hypothetical protein [Sulfuriflexus mobilis]
MYKSAPGWLPVMLLAILALAVSMPLFATSSQLPSYYPDTFQATGIITDPKDNRSVIISGLRYYVTNNTRVHTTRSQTGSLYELDKIGTELGFTYVEDNQRRRFLVEAWTLPKGTVELD